MAKIGPLHEAEGAPPGGAVLLEHVGAGDVGGHQVGRELDAVEGEVEHLGQGGDEQRLGQPGHAHEEAVAAGEERDEQRVDHRPAGRRCASRSRRAAVRLRLGQLVDGGEVGLARRGGRVCRSSMCSSSSRWSRLRSRRSVSPRSAARARRCSASPSASAARARPAWISGSNGSCRLASRKLLPRAGPVLARTSRTRASCTCSVPRVGVGPQRLRQHPLRLGRLAGHERRPARSWPASDGRPGAAAVDAPCVLLPGRPPSARARGRSRRAGRGRAPSRRRSRPTRRTAACLGSSLKRSLRMRLRRRPPGSGRLGHAAPPVRSKAGKGMPSAAGHGLLGRCRRAASQLEHPAAPRRARPAPASVSTATATSAKASAAVSWEGSLAIDGCICSKVTSLPVSGRVAGASAADQGERIVAARPAPARLVPLGDPLVQPDGRLGPGHAASPRSGRTRGRRCRASRSRAAAPWARSASACRTCRWRWCRRPGSPSR